MTTSVLVDAGKKIFN